MQRNHAHAMLDVWTAPAIRAGLGVFVACGETASYRIKNSSVKIR